MFVFLIENTCVLYGRVPFQQIGGILMGIKRDYCFVLGRLLLISRYTSIYEADLRVYVVSFICRSTVYMQSTKSLNMFVFLIENTCVLYGRVPFQQIGGILMGIKRDPRIANLFLYSLHADYKQGLMRKCEKKLAVSLYIYMLYLVLVSPASYIVNM
jgi:hypothetical protein